jgi:hypothetical protein
MAHINDVGDPAAVHTSIAGAGVLAQLIDDDSWRNLDLSGIIGVAARLVLVKAYIIGNAADLEFRIRTDGNANAINIGEVITPGNNVPITADLWVFTSAAGVIEYWADSALTTCQLTVRGWLTVPTVTAVPAGVDILATSQGDINTNFTALS